MARHPAFFGLLFLLSLPAFAQNESPPIETPSPDHHWVFLAHWIQSNDNAQGYQWTLKNIDTGRTYFDVPLAQDDLRPKRLSAEWSPNSHYLVLSLYYGRAVQDVALVAIESGNPDFIGIFLRDTGKSVEESLLHPDDAQIYKGYNRLLQYAEKWLNNTDLQVGVTALIFLEDPKTGKKFDLSIDAKKIVRFEGKSSQVIDTKVEYYDKQEEHPAPVTP